MILPATVIVVFLGLLVSPSAVAADRDRDRMPDAWEKRHAVKKARGDKDRDGLRNRDEYRARTHPRRRDTDRDGLRDGDEIRFGWHPRKRDTDRDGIRDGRENAGVVSAVDGVQMTIELARGGALSGRLEDPQALACTPAPPLPPLPRASGSAPSTGASAGPGPREEEIEWDPSWGEQPANLDEDEDEGEDGSLLARAAQAIVEDPSDDEDAAVEAEEAADEAAGIAEDEAADAEDCRAALRVGALVHEATSVLDPAGRRLTRLRLVA